MLVEHYQGLSVGFATEKCPCSIASCQTCQEQARTAGSASASVFRVTPVRRRRYIFERRVTRKCVRSTQRSRAGLWHGETLQCTPFYQTLARRHAVKQDSPRAWLCTARTLSAGRCEVRSPHPWSSLHPCSADAEKWQCNPRRFRGFRADAWARTKTRLPSSLTGRSHCPFILCKDCKERDACCCSSRMVASMHLRIARRQNIRRPSIS